MSNPPQPKKVRPTLLADAIILSIALSWIVFRTLAGVSALWLLKVSYEKACASGLLPSAEVYPSWVRTFARAATTWQSAGTIIGLCFGTAMWKAIERLYFHPLRRFPGPKLAAFTKCYEFYYDVICGGQYTFVLPALHEKYGPIIRISPLELHISDPDFYEQLYTGASNPRDKEASSAEFLGERSSIIATVSHEKHRARRAPLNGLFSKRSVSDLTDSVLERVERLSQRAAKLRNTGDVLSLKHAYSALTMDIVTEYSFGQSQDALKQPDFDAVTIDGFDNGAEGVWITKFFPLLAVILRDVPLWVAKAIDPGVAAIMNIQKNLGKQVEALQAQPPEKHKESRTVFGELLTSPDLPTEDRTKYHLVMAATNLVGAGVTTTAYALSATTFHLLDNPKILQRLKEELKDCIADPDVLPPLAQLEKLEYLTAVITEGHRITNGVTHRLPRVSPHKPIQYGDWTIPAGWPVGMTSIIQHQDPKLFPNPLKFDPDRFLGEYGAQRRKYLVPFSKGTRRCIGENLATAELYLTLAAMFRRFDFELFETTRKDIDVDRDQMQPLPVKGSKGLRVLVK